MTKGSPKGHVIALSGKGGVGKTSVAAMMARLLRGRSEFKALFVDADHAGGLTMALGADADVRKTLDDVRRATVEQIRDGGGATKRQIPETLDYLLLEALVEWENIALLSMGRPVERGCYCALNRLLRESISRLSSQFDIVIVDAEAGVEQVNRDVLGSIDALLLVTDTSMKGLHVAETIRKVATEMSQVPEVGLIINGARRSEEWEAVEARTELPVFGRIPDDDVVRRFDADMLSFFDLPECPALEAVGAVIRTCECLEWT